MAVRPRALALDAYRDRRSRVGPARSLFTFQSIAAPFVLTPRRAFLRRSLYGRTVRDTPSALSGGVPLGKRLHESRLESQAPWSNLYGGVGVEEMHHRCDAV